MSEDRRQGDRRKNNSKEIHEKKTLTVTLTAFVTFVAVIAIIFITAACFLAVYYERRINDIYSSYDSSQELVYTESIDDTDYFDMNNIINDPNASSELITDPDLFDDDSVNETTNTTSDESDTSSEVTE